MRLAVGVVMLVVGPRHRDGFSRLVPVDLIGMTTDGPRMRCTTAQFEALPTAGGTATVVGPYQDPGTQPIVALRHGDRIRATDAEVGRLHGLRVAAGGSVITHVLLDVDHLRNKHRIAVPIAVVSEIGDGIRIALTASDVLVVGQDVPADS